MEVVERNKPPLSKTELMSIETSLKSRMQVLHDNAAFNAILKLNKTTEPYRVVFKDRSWYMDAYCYLKESFNVYKLARISNLNIGEPFSRRDYHPISYNGEDWMEKDKVPVTLPVNKVIIDQFLELLGRENVKK
ncbi:WYL domain-containing protein [Oceanobacillus sojae]|uniref:WYL domain-containing protein n=1 Tax=Oceanobacillus sojae TaxID=582851 RepID=UPI0021A43923|nr:WYL domain-containing protein [Oceanobacillus sojae]MCT1904492.1 WYL domain-containing protein [Oceanobacillus sojae]